MAQAQGYNAWAGIGVETVLGTTVPRTKFVDFISEGVKLTPQRKKWTNVGETAMRINTELGRHSEGPLEVYGVFEGLDSFFKAAFGASSVTSAVVSGTAYGHTYALKDALPSPGLSLEINRDVKSFLYADCQIDEVEFIQDPTEYLKVRFGFRGRMETPITASSPVFLTPLKLHAAQVTCKVSTVVTTLNSFRVLIRNNVTAFRPQLGSADSKEFIRGEKRAVTGSVSLAFEDMVRYTEFTSVANVALEFKYVGAIISGAESYQFRLNLPQINWEGDTPQVGSTAPIDFTMPFTALETVRGANDECSLFIENSLTSVT